MLILSICVSLLMRRLGVSNDSIAMVLLLGVLFTSVVTSSSLWGAASALASVMAFNFLFTAPVYTFLISSSSDLMLFAFFLVTAVVAGQITSRLRQEMELAGRNERTARTLYKISSGFLSADGREDIVKKGRNFVKKYTGLGCDVALDGSHSDREGSLYPIESSAGRIGELCVFGGEPGEQEELMLQAVATQMGIALEREDLVEQREDIGLAMERERQRSTLLRSVAHDLRSPLTALSGAGSLLADSYDELPDSERRRLASDMAEEIAWLTDLVENILNMTRISEGQLVVQKQPEVIDDIISEAATHTERLLRDRVLTVALPEDVTAVPMDGKLIGQVVINLLENAVRHTPEGGAISLTADVSGGRLTVSVGDNGDGIPDELKERVFERFVTRGGRVLDGKRGLGLGLSICRAIVEAHGGRIWAEDNEPQGVVFRFTLPMEGNSERG